MSITVIPCQRCDARLERRDEASASITCPQCRSLISLVGATPIVVADQPELPAPRRQIRVGSEGDFGGATTSRVDGRVHVNAGGFRAPADLWFARLADGRRFVVREARDEVTFLVPFEPAVPLSVEDVREGRIGESVSLSGFAATIEDRARVTLLGQAGETPFTAWPDDPIGVVVLDAYQLGTVVVYWTPEETLYYTSEEADEHLVWALGGDVRGLDAMERHARQTAFAEGLLPSGLSAGGVMLAGAIILVAAGMGMNQSSGVLLDDWHRFDIESHTLSQVRPVDELVMEPGLGMYEVSATCQVDGATQGIGLALADGPTRIPILQCHPDDGGALEATRSVTVHVDTPGVREVLVAHDPLEGAAGKASILWTVRWRLATVFWTWLAAGLLFVLGGGSIAAGLSLPKSLQERADRRLKAAQDALAEGRPAATTTSEAA